MREGGQNVNVQGTPSQAVQAEFFDDFEGLLTWSESTTNASGAVTKDTAVCYQGNASLKLNTGATMPAINDIANSGRMVVIGRQRFVEALVKWRIEDENEQAVITFVMEVHGDERRASYYFIFDTTTHQLIYFDASGNPVVINTDDAFVYPTTWQHWRMVVDRVTRQFVSLETNSKKFDLTGIGALDEDVNFGEFIHFFVVVQTKQTAEKIMYVDNVAIRGTDQP